MVNVVLRDDLRPRDFPRDSIHHDTPKAFPHIFILSSSRTSKEGFLFPMVSLGTPLENGEGMKPSPLVELNPNMLVRDVERMAWGGCLKIPINPSVVLLTE